MKCHQIFTGACNAGDKCFAVGSVEGFPFTVYAAGCNVVILAKNFERVQVIAGICHDNIQISCIDSSSDTGKVAAAYGKIVCIYEPTPLQVQNSAHKLDYRWIQTGSIDAKSCINTLSWNLEGSRLITAGDTLQLWAPPAHDEEYVTRRISFDLHYINEPDCNWICLWEYATASPTILINFSPDGTLFATCAANDRLVKVWYDNKLILSPASYQERSTVDLSRTSISYGFIYLSHPSAVTGFKWRSTSKYMPKGSVCNMLVTSCRDNICRVWSETVLPDDGLVSLPHIDPVASQNPRFLMHRHKHRFMQRLKHIKTCFHMRRMQQSNKPSTSSNNATVQSCPIPSLPSNYSVHDFHMYGLRSTGVTPGFHFHLSATINAQTDIPLVPILSAESEQNFVVYWLNNKEMTFTTEAENILFEVTKKALEREISDHDQSIQDQESKRAHGRHGPTRGKSADEDDTLSTGDALDRRIENLLRNWLSSSDVLFSIHPADGSLLMWVIDHLDGSTGTFRQAQVSFSARIPSALPLGDAMTMEPNLAMYNGSPASFFKTLSKLESQTDEERAKNRSKSNLTVSSSDDVDASLPSNFASPLICLTTKHTNGSLNLWHLSVAEGSNFTHVVNISHCTRVSGHRFPLYTIKCHPVLPLLLTTSHHNKSFTTSPVNPPSTTASEDTPLICIQDSTYKDWCSELILWRVESVGPLGISGGVTELSRINSPQISAFSHVAWLPTLLPSTTLGKISNSPSACFVASDGECLHVYQALIDGRALLAELSTAERKRRNREQTMSLSTDSSLQDQDGQNLGDIFNLVSEQSTARPGCILKLDAIIDATHDWQNTQFMHVFQEGMVRGERATLNTSFDSETGGTRKVSANDHVPTVDFLSQSTFEEPFYVTLLEKMPKGPVMHMWKLVTASGVCRKDGDRMQESLEASPLTISTSKVYCEKLPLPVGVEVVHACPVAGHLSSASIYPACFAPYLLVTACSDNYLRFWRCRMTGEGPTFNIEWQEWWMISKDRTSAIKVSGELLYVEAAYSGRIAVAHKRLSEDCVTASNNSLVFSSVISIYECESTGGSEWVLSDTIELRDTILNQGGYIGQEIDWSCLNEKSDERPAVRLTQALSAEDPVELVSEVNRSSSVQVPSLNTVKSLKSNSFDKVGVELKQKYPVQLSWMSMENGTHLLTVTMGSKVSVYTCVSESFQGSDKLTEPHPKLKPSMSVSQNILSSNTEVTTKWMCLVKFSLSSADGLTPLPMAISWVRDGVLVIGMDNEIQVCTQWSRNGENEEALTFGMGDRDLTYNHLKKAIRDSTSQIHKSMASMSRITSYSVLSTLDHKMKKGLGDVIENPIVQEIEELSSSGVFETSHLVSPVRPQYDPKQLIELLNSGKIRRVKAILAHLLRCLMVLSHNTSETTNRDSFSENEDKKPWLRSRTMSISAAAAEGRNSLKPEELTLDYIEVKAIPPLPLWLLLEADKDTHKVQRTTVEKKDDTYAELFGPVTSASDDDELDLAYEDQEMTPRRKSMIGQEKKSIAFFGPRQAQCLAGLLTHTHLPGLSSLEQMHLLALADTVASCNVDIADKFAINKAKELMAKETYGRSATDEPSMDSLDDCGLRYLLAIRHHTYLLRCLPIGQRAQLQKAGIGTHNIAWAFHSESQEDLLNFIPNVRQANIRWSELRELGVGWWIRSNTVLSNLLLKVAKSAFQAKNDPLDAAIYYLCMKKKSLVWGLFRSINDSRMTDFFSNNFQEERWRKAALKNAYALMGKQRFEHAAAFFLLAGGLKDAIEVVLSKLHDEQLAFVIIRLYEGELDAIPESLLKLLYTKFLGCDEDGRNQSVAKCHPDPFLRSISYWLLKNYNDSLKTLLESDALTASSHPEFIKVKNLGENLTSASPNVFNFYIYLRTHPLLIRQCIANATKDTTGTLMASKLGSKHDAMDKKALYESSMTPQERCLYFKSANAHLNSGCPTLALEVLSKLPTNVIDLDNPNAGDLLGSPIKEKKHGLDLIKSGTFEDSPSFKLTTQAAVEKENLNFDWSIPSFTGKLKNDLELDLDFSIEQEEDEEEEEAKLDGTEDIQSRKRLDIMAQQLKFICCLKMMTEELSTLATGCEVDGGQLRYQLYVWLEREVEALKEICNYRTDFPSSGMSLGTSELEEVLSKSPQPNAAGDASTLHEILQQETQDFENKRKRAVTRKFWLIANQQLLRTLLSYCSLHGSSGGGLSSVRMELILLLQELQQENNKQQLLSPLPLPTTLPLLSASIASHKTVVSDPVKYLQNTTHDQLHSLVKIESVATPDIELMKMSLMLRNLAAALSACIYQCVCDYENISLKGQPRVAALGLDLQHVSVAHKESHLIGKEIRSAVNDNEYLQICTPPSKWPGVKQLIALMSQERDDDSPKLNILLCEAFISVYLCLLVHGIASSDAYVLYRLVSVDFKQKDWGRVFGGGVKKTMKVITNVAAHPPTEKIDASASQAGGESILSTISNLQKSRIKLNMKFLSQLGFQDPRAAQPEGDIKTGTREQFCPPELSIVSYLMAKPTLPADQDLTVDYDSCSSDDDYENYQDDEEDVFNETSRHLLENTEHCNTDSYSWRLLRLACVRRAQNVLCQFLTAAEIDFQELVVISPLLHSITKTLERWEKGLVAYIEEKKGPPPEFIPGCFAQSHSVGPIIQKYKALLEAHNTPFALNKKGVKPVNRLWNYLVRQESVQPIFIRYIFGRKRPAPMALPSESGEEILNGSVDGGEINGSEVGTDQREPSEVGGGGSDSSTASLEPVRIIHKDNDSITAFCMNKVNNNLVSIATVKEIQELDISLLLKHPNWLVNECELDVLALDKDLNSMPGSNYMVIQTPYDKAYLEGKGALDPTFSVGGSPTHGQTGRGSNVVLTYKQDNAKRMSSHPSLPLYLVGCQDGSLTVREWRHSQIVSQPRPGGTFAKVARVRFNQHGNKFGVIDSDGHLSLYHLGMAQQEKAFYTHQCHNKHGNDFTFVGSSSLLATAGQSSEHRNVALWDTLMPQRKANIVSWTCHDSGASCVLYAAQHQILISAGKKGQVHIYDVRQRTLRHRFQAHESASIKCMALDINEEFFVTGSSDGDIRVWNLAVHNMIYNLPGEHSRSSLFKNLSKGVTHLSLDSSNRLFSCGADGSVKMRCIPDPEFNINAL